MSRQVKINVGDTVHVGEGSFLIKAVVTKVIPHEFHGIQGYQIRIPETTMTVLPKHVKEDGRS